MWLSNRGLHQHRSGRLDQAARDFSEAITLMPHSPQLHLNRGAAYGVAGELDKALLDFERVIELDPASADGHMNRATALEKMGRYAESLAGYDMALSLRADDGIALDGRCWVRAVIGTDLSGAMSDCEKALTLRPGAANIMNTQGFIRFRQTRFDEAIAHYDKSIALDSNVASSFYIRGLARKASGRDGSDDIAKGLSMEPGIQSRYAGYGIDP
jgi:tetratricopeptide (TPR) repeat protein